MSLHETINGCNVMTLNVVVKHVDEESLCPSYTIEERFIRCTKGIGKSQSTFVIIRQ